MKILDPFGFLLGSWQVERFIEDHRTGVSGAFNGAARFSQRERRHVSCFDTTVRFHETGELHFGAFRGPSQRSLEYVQVEGPVVQIRFTDGRPFVDLDLSSGTSRSTHTCGLDQYRITFVAKSSDVFEESWRVQGPTKDYHAVTTLTRGAVANLTMTGMADARGEQLSANPDPEATSLCNAAVGDCRVIRAPG